MPYDRTSYDKLMTTRKVSAMPKLSYGKARVKVLEKRMNEGLEDEEKHKFLAAVEALVAGVESRRGRALEMVNELWYGVPPAVAPRAGGRKRSPHHGEIIARMIELRSQGLSEQQVVDQIEDDLSAGKLLPDVDRAKLKGTSTRTLWRLIAIAFERKEKKRSTKIRFVR
jgi:hypothetical protein